uniref:CCHC-type domain-containing protein n=1 Tax=Tanacetum cinerariifolium TaxID=118510 RepID=A0A6L2MG83_TANCI|nr:hypothetical protein [Tanacetum cinerariifolium]
MLLAQAQVVGVALDLEQISFLVDTGERVDSGTDAHALTETAILQTDELDAFKIDCDKAPTVSEVFMANLTSYDSNVLSDVPNYNTYHDNIVFEQSVQEMHYSEQHVIDDDSNIEITSDNNVISYDQYLKEKENEVFQSTTSHEQQDAIIMSAIDEMNNKEAHVNYLKVTKENADTLRDIVKQARASKPSNNALDYACMDETFKFIIKFLKKVQVALNATFRNIRTDNGTGFVNQTLKSYYEDVGITRQTLTARTPHQNGIVESEDLRNLKPKDDINIFIGYVPAKKAYRIYNKQKRLIMKTIHVEFDVLTSMSSKQFNSGPAPLLLTPGYISFGLMQNPPLPSVVSPVPPGPVPIHVDTTGTPSSTIIDQDAPSASTSPTTEETQALIIHQGDLYKLLVMQIMPALAIAISFDSLDECVGSPLPQVILFGDITVVIPSISMVAQETSTTTPVFSSAALVIETTIVASPTRLCGLVPYLDSNSDLPNEMDSPKHHHRRTLMLLPLLIGATGYTDPKEDIPLDRPYRTRPNGPQRVMTVRKRVGPLPASRHSWRCVSPHSSNHHPYSSSLPTDSSPVHSSGLDAPVTGSLAPTCADLLPPRKGFRDSYSYETSMEEDTEIDTTKTEDGRELDIFDGDDVRDHIKVDPRDDKEEFEANARDTIMLGIDPRSVSMVDEEIVELVRGDSFSSFATRDGTVRIVWIETTQRQLEADQMISSGARASMAESIRSLRSENLKVRALLCIERDRMDSLRLNMSRSQEEFRQIRDDRDDLRRKLRRLWLGLDVSSRCFVNQGGNGNGDGRGDRLIARECTYQDFMKCQPLNFKGTEGIVGLIRWCEKMETVFHISNCPERYQVKYATCTLLDDALTWWNSHMRTIGTDSAYTLSWRELKKLLIEVFQELTMMCTKMVLEEEDRVKRFIKGLPNNIQGCVMATELTRLQDVVRIANNMMDKKLKGYAVRNVENKRRLDANRRDDHGQQPPFRRQHTRGQNVARDYTAVYRECSNCKRVRHKTRDCRSAIAATTQGTPRPNQRVNTCFECRAPGHYRKDCPKIKNQNRKNKARIPEARGKAYVLGGGDANPGSNTVTGTFLPNDHHAYMLFDSGANRSFVSNTFSMLLDITPSTLDVSYAVELADERTS